MFLISQFERMVAMFGLNSASNLRQFQMLCLDMHVEGSEWYLGTVEWQSISETQTQCVYNIYYLIDFLEQCFLLHYYPCNTLISHALYPNDTLPHNCRGWPQVGDAEERSPGTWVACAAGEEATFPPPTPTI